MPTSPLAIEPAVLTLSRSLRARGLLTEVQVSSVCGEPDVRLITCRQGGDVAVELLASLAVERPADRWHAVQVRGADREVWQGPPHDAPPDEVVAFVEALLALRTSRLPYPRLG